MISVQSDQQWEVNIMSTTLLSRSTRHADEVTESAQGTANPIKDFHSNHIALKHFLSTSSRLNRVPDDGFIHASHRTSLIAQRSLISRLAVLATRNHPADGKPGCFSKAMTSIATNIATAKVLGNTATQRPR